MIQAQRLFDFRPTGFLNLRGYCAEYADFGIGDPIIVLPGLMGGVGLLTPMIRQLSKRHRVIAFQLRGESQPLFDRAFGFQRLVDDLDEVISQLHLERPGLVGVSFGGALALDYVANHPNRVNFLAIQGCASQFHAGLFCEVARQVLDRFPLPHDNPHVNQFFRLLMPQRCAIDSSLDLVIDQCWRTDQSVISHRMAMLEDYDVAGRIAEVKTPTLAFSCDTDVLVSDREIEQMTRNLPRGQVHRLKDAGHLAYVSHADRMVNAIAEFAVRCHRTG